MIDELFCAIDAKRADAFSGFLAEDCVFRFGNQAAVIGRPAVTAYVAAFFDSIRAIEHRIEDAWHVDGAVVCHGLVTYTRLNGSQMTVPFANALKLVDRKIGEYLIFADTSALYSE